jgi:two-component system, response regulator
MNDTTKYCSSEVEILLVEDNPLDADLTQRELQKYHLANHLVWVKDGAEALGFLFGDTSDPSAPLACSPKLILLDLKLPKVDGHEVLKRIKSDPRTMALPIVMLTSSSEEADMLRSYELGVNSYIIKPVEFEKFTEAVRQLGLYWLLLNQSPNNRSPE